MKRGAFTFILVFSIILLLPMVFADELTQVEKAYSCLEGKINSSKCSTLTFDEKVFSLLATGLCKNEVVADGLSEQCWPKSGCKIKSTAQAILALNKEGINTTKAENWLLSKTTVPSNIDWFLEIESNGATTCTIIYSDTTTTYNLAIAEDKTLSSSNLGNCLSLAQDNYWLKISPSCYNKEIRVSCAGVNKQGFITTLLFKNPSTSTINVFGSAKSATSGGTTIEKVETSCFSDDGKTCNYEGSLWASFSLYSLGHTEVSKFLPYLLTSRVDNSKYLPETFLSFLTGEFKTELLAKQKAQLYWEESGDKYYDTALALWPFRYESPYEKGYSKDWLLRVQESNGCWNGGNIVDNAFILYSIWYKGVLDSGTCLFASNCIQVSCEVASCVGGVCLYDYSTECKDGDECCNSGCTYKDDSDCEIGENECKSKEDCSYFDTTSYDYCSNDKTKVLQDIVEGTCKDRVCIKTETTETVETCASTEECNSGYCEIKDNSCETSEECPGEQVCDTYYGECVDKMDCIEGGYFCVSNSKCFSDYLIGEEYSCSTGFVCCSEQSSETCTELGGKICNSNQFCSSEATISSYDSSSETPCCLVECQSLTCTTDSQCPEEEGYICGSDGFCVEEVKYTCGNGNTGVCKSSCGKKETSSSYTCESGKTCCIKKTGGSNWWIWVLIVLIILTLIGIVFKDKLRTFLFRFKSKMGGKNNGPPRKPGMPMMAPIGPPVNPQARVIPRRILPPSQGSSRPPMRRPMPQSNKPHSTKKPDESKGRELDDVLKKLKEMGK